MNDNKADFHADRRHDGQMTALTNLNIGANGRWFMLALVAIAIADGNLKLAVILACMIGLAVLFEQLKQPFRAIAAYALYAWAAVLAIVMLVIV